ncbi:MAG: HAD family hydrolase [Fusobacteriaceae bacterium]|nr:HAD family hydrolase [Fusobacteriaceae bacterium]MBN2837795.1 HAD family hydrolase [Fusobacteriaceae bacterium]
MKKKAIFFDIDGTIMTEDNHIIPKSTIKSLRKAKENGHLLFINTGRTFHAIPKEIKDLEFNGYVCGCGTHIFYNGKAIFEKELSNEKCREIVGKLREYDITAIPEGNEAVYFDNLKPLTKELIEIKEMFKKQGIDTTKTWDDDNLNFSKFVMWINKNSKKEEFFEYILDEFDYIDRGNDFFEIVPKGFSKATGIECIQEHLDIKLEDCFAIGDSNNDLPMFNYISNSIAMGNSHPSLFDIVSFVTKRIEDDGIEYALKHFSII